MIDRSSWPLRIAERLSWRLPIEIPPAVSNAYLRKTVDDDFDGYVYPPDPFRVLWVDPDRIERFTGRPYPPYRRKVADLGRVRDGEWDRTDPPIADEAYRHRYDLYRAEKFSGSVFYRSLRERFEEHTDWTETKFVRRCLDLAADDEPSWRSTTSEAEILRRCEEVDALYESIREDGYRSQRDLGVRSILRVTDEVLVDVARDGTLLFVSGRHRLAIAKLLGVEAIPVGVLVRHADWMDSREAYAQEGAGAADSDSRRSAHPDLRDLARTESSEMPPGTESSEMSPGTERRRVDAQ